MQKPFTPQFEPLILPEYAAAVTKQIESGWVGTSKTTLEFEATICKITGAKYCLSTASGTTALMIAVAALELPPTSTILFPAYTFVAGANAARFLGHHIKLVDVRPETMSMNPDLVPENETVMFVNHNGYTGNDLHKIKAKSKFLIEDASQGLGIPNAGRTGDLGVFSFSVPKIVTTGQGGAVITDNPHLYENCRRIRDHGEDWRKDRIHKHLGVNFKFNDILAAFGLEQLKKLDYLLEKRKQLFDDYRQYIEMLDHGMPSAWMVVYKTNHGDQIIEKLKIQNIDAVRYYRPINHNPIYQDDMVYPGAEEVYRTCIYLPSSLTLDDRTIEKICRIIYTA